MKISIKWFGLIAVLTAIILLFPKFTFARIVCQCEFSCDASVYRETAGTINFVKLDETVANISNCTSFFNTFSDSELQPVKNSCQNYSSLSRETINSTLKTQNCRPADSAVVEADQRAADRANELESVNQQEAALNSANFWSCYMEFKEKAPDTTEIGITRFSGGNTICKDYKQAGSPNESVAEKKCLDTCDKKVNPDSACLSLFIRSKSCQDLQNSNENITYKGVPLSELSVRVKPSLNALNKLGNLTISQLIGRGIRVLMSVLGSIALMIFIYSGLLWMTSRGDSGKAETSRNAMLWAALGVVVVLTSYAIVDFLFGTVFK